MRKRLHRFYIPSKNNDYRPHVFRGKAIAGIVLLVIALVALASLSTPFLQRSGLLGAIYSSVLVDLANDVRQEENLTPLSVDPRLTQAAQLKANHMAENGYFSHNGPEGRTPWHWIGVAGYKFIYAGENLAINFSYSEDVNDAWLASTGHRANILNGNYTEVGIATAEGEYEGRETTFVVQMFGTPVPDIMPRGAVVTENTTTVSESPQPTPAPQVQAEPQEDTTDSIQVTEEIITEEERFIAFEDRQAIQEVRQQEGAESEVTPVTQGAEAPGYEAVSRWYEWVVLHPQTTLRYVLYTAFVAVLIAFILMIALHTRIQRPKNILYGIFVLSVLAGAIYLAHSTYLTDIVNALW